MRLLDHSVRNIIYRPSFGMDVEEIQLLGDTDIQDRALNTKQPHKKKHPVFAMFGVHGSSALLVARRGMLRWTLKRIQTKAVYG
jgi:hypothetical protein